MARSRGRHWNGIDERDWLLLGCPTWGDVMPIDPDLLELLVEEITIEPYVSTSFEHVVSYGASVPYQVKIDADVVSVLRDTGDVVKSTHKIVMDDVYTIDARSRITLPSRFVERNPEILGDKSRTDEIGLHHTTLLVDAKKGANA